MNITKIPEKSSFLKSKILQRPQSAKLFLTSGFDKVLIPDNIDPRKHSKTTIGNSQHKINQNKSIMKRMISRPQSAIIRKNENLYNKKNEFFFDNQNEVKNQYNIVKEVFPFQDYSKMRPKYIKIEKEKLTQDKNELNSNIKELKEENLKMKNKKNELEKENQKIHSIINDLELYISTKVGIQKFDLSNKNNFMILSLKKQIDQLKKEINDKEDEITLLKKNPKILKLDEMHIEMKSYAQEAKRLKYIVEKNKKLKNLQKENNKENNILELENNNNKEFYLKLKQERLELKSTIKLLEEQIFEIETLKENDKKKKFNNLNEFEKVKLVLNFKDKEIYQLEEEINKINEEIIKLAKDSQSTIDYESKFEKLKLSEHNIKAHINQKEQMIAYQEKNMKELKNKMQEKSNFELKEKKILQEKLNNQKEKTLELENRIKNITVLLNLEEKKKNEEIKQIEQDSESKEQIKMDLYHDKEFSKILELSPTENNEGLNQSKIRFKKRLPTVKLSDVKSIGIELNLRFKIMKIDILTIISKFLFTEKMLKKKTVKIEELIPILIDEPFSLENEEQALLLARYLIEDNSDHYIELDLKHSNKLITVQSIFKKVVGEYKITSYDEEKKLKEEIYLKLKKFKNSILQAYDIFEESKGKTFVSSQTIFNIFKYLDIDLSVKHLDYINLQLFKLSNNLNHLEFKQIFNIFSLENYEKNINKSPTRSNYIEKSSPLSPFTPDLEPAKTKLKRSRLFKYKDLDKINYFGLEINKTFLFYGEIDHNNDQWTSIYISNWIINNQNEIIGEFCFGAENIEVLSGKYSNNNQKIQVITKSFEFNGVYNEVSKIISGKWKSGNFVFYSVDKIWKFRLTQNSYNSKDSIYHGILAIKNKQDLIGKGVDDGGGYVWNGNIENSNVKLFKCYPNGNKILYDGFIKGNIIQGTFSSPEDSGQFSINFKEII